MKQEDIRHFYAGVTSKLLTGIRDAAMELAPAHAERGLHFHDIDNTADGSVLYSGAVVFTRSADDDSFIWTVAVGFDNGSDFDSCINWSAPRGHFPGMEVPIKASWDGTDHWGGRRHENLSVPSIRLTQNRIQWLEKSWSVDEQPDASWIVRQLLDGYLLQESPDAAREHVLLALPGGRWKRTRQLKAWGPNEVWEVQDLTDSRSPRRAMKTLRFRRGPGTTAHQRLLREITTTRELATQHPGIVPVLDFGVPQDGDVWTPFYVMPLAEATLAKAKEYKENLEGVLRLAIALADALAAAHKHSVIHRDVKPDNILLLGEDRRPVIADFGICFLASEEGDRVTATDAGTVGPANYVAPELLGGRADAADIDGRADVYSLGKTLYYAYSGGQIFPREYYTQDEYDLRKSIEDPRIDHFYGLLERMVVEKPDGRFTDMLACRDALVRALENIRKGIPYEPGMYGRLPTPLEVMQRFTRDYESAQGVRRSDLLRNELSSAHEELEVSAAALDDSKPLAGAQELMMQRGFKGAERLLALGLPLILGNDMDGFPRWLELILELLGSKSDRLSHRPQATIRGAGALAFHGGAVVAAYRERFGLLQTMLDRYLEHRSWFVHLDMFSDKASRSWEWIAGCVRELNTIKHAETRLANETETVLSQVMGLSVLRFLITLNPADLARLVPIQGSVLLDALPGLFPGVTDWIESLPKSFLTSPTRERNVAAGVFGVSPKEFREQCNRITPNLLRALQGTARHFDNSPHWISGALEKGTWHKWCGRALTS